jgi:hypothetical protein
VTRLGSASDLEDLTTRTLELAEMADRLAARDDAQDAARETEELLCMVRQWQNRAEVRVRRLSDVWRAMDDLDDDPHSKNHRERLQQALAAHRGGEAP